MTALWIALYFAVGAVVFIAIRSVYKKTVVPVSDHWGFFTGDVIGFLLWPLAAIASLVWLVTEWSAAREKKKWKLAEAERKRAGAEDPYRSMSVDQLLAAVDSAKKCKRPAECLVDVSER